MSVFPDLTTEKLYNTFAVFKPKTAANSASLPAQKESKKDKFERKYGMLYTAGAIAAAGGIFFALHRGGILTNLRQIVKQKINRWTVKIQESKSQETNMTFAQKMKLRLIVGATKFLKNLQGLGNINPAKDILTDRVLRGIENNTPIKAKSFFDKITEVFVRFGKKLAGSKYKKPATDLNSFVSVLNRAIDDISKLPENRKIGNFTPAELTAKLRELAAQAEQDFTAITKGFDNRFDRMIKTLNETSEEKFLSSLKFAQGSTKREKFFNKIRELCDFIPTKEMKPCHDRIFSPLFTIKKNISNSILDLNKTLSTAIDNIFYNNALQHAELRQNYHNLRKLLSKLSSPKDFNLARKDVRAALIQEFQKTAENFDKYMPGTKNSEYIRELLTLVSSDKKGAVEEAVSLLKGLKSQNPKLYNELVAARNNFQKSFNRAIEFETDKSYRKMLDFSLHSLTTDLFTQAIGIGAVGSILANRKETAKEKVPKILKEGIPVVGGLAVAFLCNLRQVASGPGSLFLAVISGLALNRIGSVISNKYVEPNKKQEIA